LKWLGVDVDPFEIVGPVAVLGEGK
jgi:hypothetical protein